MPNKQKNNTKKLLEIYYAKNYRNSCYIDVCLLLL